MSPQSTRRKMVSAIQIFSARFVVHCLALISPAVAQTAYVSNFSDDSLSVIDTPTNQAIAVVPVGRGPVGVAVSPDGRTVYVTNSGADTVSVIDTKTYVV